jgi:hypothetical protein
MKEHFTMTNEKTLTHADLLQFTGSENWYRHPINRAVLYTDGAKYVSETGGAYWLLDEIALIQPYNKEVSREEFQVWTLRVNTNNQTGTATLFSKRNSPTPIFFWGLRLRPSGHTHTILSA